VNLRPSTAQRPKADATNPWRLACLHPLPCDSTLRWSLVAARGPVRPCTKLTSGDMLFLLCDGEFLSFWNLKLFVHEIITYNTIWIADCERNQRIIGCPREVHDYKWHLLWINNSTFFCDMDMFCSSLGTIVINVNFLSIVSVITHSYQFPYTSTKIALPLSKVEFCG